MRTRVKTTKAKLPNGTVVERRSVVAAPELEWVLQAAQIRALRSLPEYGSRFLLVGGMEAGRRSPREAVKAKATGLTAGHPDLTIFMGGGRAGFIENKAEKGRLSPAQVERHVALRALGFDVEVIRASTESEAALRAVATVRGWLELPTMVAPMVAANENAHECENNASLVLTGA